MDLQFLINLKTIQNQIEFYGIRRLVFVEDSAQYWLSQRELLQTKIPGDWIILSDHFNYSDYKFNQAKNLLGSEFKHAIFDATKGFSLDVFVILAGTLRAGSFLFFLISKKSDWIYSLDLDSLRWNNGNLTNSKNFKTFFYQIIEKDNTIIFIQKKENKWFLTDLFLFENQTKWQKINKITKEQELILHLLKTERKGQFALLAKRGRGKSTLAGMLANELNCWICAPSKHAVSSVYSWVEKNNLPFFSPKDALKCSSDEINKIDFLIIDEAASIPLFILNQLVEKYPNILFITTTQGYEGSANGFSHIFCSNLKNLTFLSLDLPIRWNKNDPLENLTEQILLDFDSKNHLKNLSNFPIMNRSNFERIYEIYHFLKKSHYKTTLIDFRRLFDANDLFFSFKKNNKNQLVAALIWLNEGNLNNELIEQIWRGNRRKKGDLVTQAIIFYLGEKMAGNLFSVRINRIAVDKIFQRKGIAKNLVNSLKIKAKLQNKDFISVSFNLTESLFLFWKNCEFSLIYISFKPETSTGNYSAMMIFPLSENGKDLVEKLSKKFALIWQYNQRKINFDLNLKKINNDHLLTQNDLLELRGFAFYHRPLESIYFILQKIFLNLARTQFPLLHFFIENQFNEEKIMKRFHIPGKTFFLNEIRKEIKLFLDYFSIKK